MPTAATSIDRPCDYNFCGNGIAYGDGEESPKMQEVKYNYQNIIAKVTDTKAVITQPRRCSPTRMRLTAS